ncbi:hypothetical protein ACAD32_02194 [Clavibacter nebraskensis]
MRRPPPLRAGLTPKNKHHFNLFNLILALLLPQNAGESIGVFDALCIKLFRLYLAVVPLQFDNNVTAADGGVSYIDSPLYFVIIGILCK